MSIETTDITSSQNKLGKFSEIRQKVFDRLRRAPDADHTALHPKVYAAPEREVDVVNSREYPRSLSPQEAAYEFTSADWTAWLTNNVEAVKQESKEVRENAGALMHELVLGVNDMYEEHIARGNKFPQKPNIVFSLVGNSAASGEGGTRIGISERYLLATAKEPIDTPRTRFGSFSDRETPAFSGTPGQDIRSCGVHETDHAQYQQTHPDLEREVAQVPGGGFTTARYDADPLELRALREQLLHAQKSGYPQETIEVFQNRISAAEQYHMSQVRNAIADTEVKPEA